MQTFTGEPWLRYEAARAHAEAAEMDSVVEAGLAHATAEELQHELNRRLEPVGQVAIILSGSQLDDLDHLLQYIAKHKELRAGDYTDDQLLGSLFAIRYGAEYLARSLNKLVGDAR
jgi:hypothetical protein